jgi:hypothetical protein
MHCRSAYYLLAQKFFLSPLHHFLIRAKLGVSHQGKDIDYGP